jgi:SAM-dependent methyltransferase
MDKIGQYIKKILTDIIYKLATFNLRPENPGEAGDLAKDFVARCRTLEQPRVLELGTRRSEPGRSTLHKQWVPHASEFLGTDIAAGEDVDFIADIHRLTQVTGEEQFDAIISCSSFEHFKYPHLAAHEIMKALRIGGVLFIQTHQPMPIHAYPYDYFRFSREGLAGLFNQEMGFKVIATDYEYPVKIYSRRDKTSHIIPAFMNVRLLGEKIGRTPSEYIYVFDA